MYSRNWCPRPRIDEIPGGARPGKVGLFVPPYFVFVLAVLLLYQAQCREAALVSQRVEDALAMSNLAAAVADMEAYGRTGRLRIWDAKQCLDLYSKALEKNLESVGGLQPGSGQLLEFAIYQPLREGVEIFYYTRGGVWEYSKAALGEVYTPNGKRVESLTVYSKAEFALEAIFGLSLRGVKENSIDVLSALPPWDGEEAGG